MTETTPDPAPAPVVVEPTPLRSPYAPTLQRLYCAGTYPVHVPGYLEWLASISYAGLTRGEVATIKASCTPPPYTP